MRAWLLDHPVTTAYVVMAGAYGVLWLMFLTPLLRTDAAPVLFFGPLVCAIGVAVWAMIRTRLFGVLALTPMLVIAVPFWLWTGFLLACGFYGECL